MFIYRLKYNFEKEVNIGSYELHWWSQFYYINIFTNITFPLIPSTYKCMHPYMHTYIYTYIHTTYIYIHTYTYMHNYADVHVLGILT